MICILLYVLQEIANGIIVAVYSSSNRLKFPRVAIGRMQCFSSHAGGVSKGYKDKSYKKGIKVVATDVRYFARSNFCRSLAPKENFTLIWQVLFKLRYVFCQER